MMDRW